MAIYRGKSVSLNKVQRGGSKKFFVLLKGNKVKKISFGDPNMKIRKNNRAARKSFLAEHRCSLQEIKHPLVIGLVKCGESGIRTHGTIARSQL